MTKQTDDNRIISLMLDSETRDKGFRMLIAKYGEKLYWYIRRIVVKHDDAEDVMQETTINIYKNIDKFRGESALSTWIYRIATNEALRWIRKQTGFWKSDNALSLDLIDNIESECRVDADDMEILFQKAILTLPTQQRLAFNMRYYDDITYEEMSKITGKNINTLKTNYHIATEKIKEYLKEHSII